MYANRIEDFPILLEAIDDTSLFRKAIETYGDKLMCIPLRKRAPEVDIFYYLIQAYTMKKIDLEQFKELCQLAISEGCRFYINCNENDHGHPAYISWSKYYSVLTDALESNIIDKNVPITPFIKILLELAEDAREIPFETVKRWLYLIEKGAKDIIQYLVEEVHISELIHDYHPETGDTLLHIACKKNDLEFVTYLIDKHVNINHPNKERALAIAFTSSKEITKLLLENGAYINTSENTSEVKN